MAMISHPNPSKSGWLCFVWLALRGFELREYELRKSFCISRFASGQRTQVGRVQEAKLDLGRFAMNWRDIANVS